MLSKNLGIFMLSKNLSEAYFSIFVWFAEEGPSENVSKMFQIK